MNDTQTYAALAVVEVAHAAAHMGHFVMHKSRLGVANQEYATIHKSYVKMGLQLAARYYRKAMGLESVKTEAA
jgi:hypothetical protein